MIGLRTNIAVLMRSHSQGVEIAITEEEVATMPGSSGAGEFRSTAWLILRDSARLEALSRRPGAVRRALKRLASNRARVAFSEHKKLTSCANACSTLKLAVKAFMHSAIVVSAPLSGAADHSLSPPDPSVVCCSQPR